MKNEIRIFFTALMFFTRIPVPTSTGYSLENLNKSVRYFPLVGGIIGVLGAGIFLVFQLVLPVYIAVLLSMATTVFITGAFHEDGFADFCDGFGGGYTKEKILTIMKDSRIGTYGSVGLIFVLATKFGSLNSMEVKSIPYMLISGHAFSRFNPVLLMFFSNYVREDADAKAKPVGNHVSKLSLSIACVITVTALFLISLKAMLVVIPVSILVYFLMFRYVNHKIGGYTGDVLGALQQLTEVFFYISVLASQTL